MPLMVPLPVPALVTVRIAVLGKVELELKVAVQIISVLIVKDGLQLIPDQPAKTEFASGVAIKAIVSPIE